MTSGEWSLRWWENLMADIGTLVVRMAADSAQMRSELDRVKGELKKTDSGVSALSGAFKNLGGIVATFSLAAVVTQAMQAAGALNDTAAKTGLSIDALQRLQFAATLSGGSLEGVSGAVARMQKALVGAEEGGKEAVAALDRLGLSAKQILTLSPDKQFEAIAQKIASIQDPAERTTAAMNLFGRSGAELIPTLLAIGTNGEAMAAQLSAIGGPVSDKAIANVDTLGDQLDVLKTGAKNTAIELTALASAILVPLLRETNEWIKSLRILTGGGGELEQLQRRLEILQEARNSIPIFFNFGYVEGQGVVLGRRGLEQAMRSVRADIDAMKASAAGAVGGIIDVPMDIPQPQVPNLGGGGGKPGERALTPAEIRERDAAKRDADFKREYDLTALHLSSLQMLSFDHASVLANIDSTSAAQRIQSATDFEYFRANIAQAFGLQQLDFETIKNQSIIDLAGGLFTALAGENTKLFKVQQAFAVANAVVNTAEGVTKALRSLPFPANLGAAAKVALAGAIQIAKIKSTAPGGSGSATTSGLSGGSTGSTPSLPQTAGNAQQAEQAPRIAQVVIQGSVFSSRETADWLVDQLKDAINNRDVVFINGNSRQAGLITGA
jgi:hypothetical protein